MSINPTLNYLKAEQSLILLCFSDAVTTSSKYLKGAGGVAGDGFPMPTAGVIEVIQVWDGVDVERSSGTVAFAAEDRISVYALNDLSEFTVYVRKNGVNTALSVGGLAENTNLLATVTIRLTE